MIRACIFDLDGTLINSLEDLADSTNFALRSKGFAPHPLEEYRYLVGTGVYRLVQFALPEQSRDEKTIAETLAVFRARYAKHSLDKTKPYDGAHTMLEELKRRGIKLAVVSNKPDALVKDLVTGFFGKELFTTIVGQKDGVPRKPDPQSTLNACAEMAVKPEECVFLGDSNVDMFTANAAGAYAVGALWGFRDADELLKAGAKKLIEKPAELPELLPLI